MRRTIASRRGYVRRLRQMMGEEGLCECCPGAVGFDVSDAADRCNRVKCWDHLEGWCRGFIGMRVFKARRFRNICPCHQDPKAPARALLALEAWDENSHPWQTNPNIDLDERLPEDE